MELTGVLFNHCRSQSVDMPKPFLPVLSFRSQHLQLSRPVIALKGVIKWLFPEPRACGIYVGCEQMEGSFREAPHLPDLLQPAEALLSPCHGCTGRRWGNLEVKVWHKCKSADSSQIVWPQHQSWLSGARLPPSAGSPGFFLRERNNRTRDLREIIEE